MSAVPAPRGEASTTAYSRELGGSRYGAHQLVASLVGRGKRVLDVGCGEGALSAHLAALGNDVVSLEFDAGMAEAARRRGLKAERRDIERDSIDDLGVFDVVVCADVLEHLMDPGAALTKLRNRIGPGGTLVCSIPNIGYYTVRLRLAFGRFDYTDGGILDHTHLHFYTHATSRRMLSDAGFHVRREEISVYLPLGVPPLTRLVNAALERGRSGAALYRACRTFPGLFAYQFVTESTVG